MHLQIRKHRAMQKRGWTLVLLCLVFPATGWGQTASDFAAKYRAIAAYEIRPGVLMRARYAQDGQVCEIVLQRHYFADQADADSSISPKLEGELIDELAPEVERGPATSKWLRNSFIAGGVSHVERDFEKVLVEVDGTVSEGIKVVTIHWKKRTCVASETSIATGKK
jgi:hypothetical protein